MFVFYLVFVVLNVIEVDDDWDKLRDILNEYDVDKFCVFYFLLLFVVYGSCCEILFLKGLIIEILCVVVEKLIGYCGELVEVINVKIVEYFNEE